MGLLAPAPSFYVRMKVLRLLVQQIILSTALLPDIGVYHRWLMVYLLSEFNLFHSCCFFVAVWICNPVALMLWTHIADAVRQICLEMQSYAKEIGWLAILQVLNTADASLKSCFLQGCVLSVFEHSPPPSKTGRRWSHNFCKACRRGVNSHNYFPVNGRLERWQFRRDLDSTAAAATQTLCLEDSTASTLQGWMLALQTENWNGFLCGNSHRPRKLGHFSRSWVLWDH